MNTEDQIAEGERMTREGEARRAEMLRRDVDDQKIARRIREGALDGDSSMTVAWTILQAVERLEAIWAALDELAELRRQRSDEEIDPAADEPDEAQ